MSDDSKRNEGAEAEEPGKGKAEDASTKDEKAEATEETVTEAEGKASEAKAEAKETAEDAAAEETASDDAEEASEEEAEETAEADAEEVSEEKAEAKANDEPEAEKGSKVKMSKDGDKDDSNADSKDDGHAHGPHVVKHGKAIVSDDPDAVGLCAFFDHPGDILAAAEKARDKGFKNWDVYTPFPVHGMDEAMGIGRSFMPYITLALALTGLTFALTLQFGTLIFDWPIIIGGKPTDFSGTIGGGWPSFAPISFELTVLFAGIGSALVMFAINGLPNLKPRLFDWRLTRDRFALWVSAND
ncbi:MAG: DUF3341 domain-containing protein, partial [Myxococcota bacterium]